MRFLRIWMTIVVFAGVLPHFSADARAETVSKWIETDQSRIRLISEFDGVKGHDPLRVGLQVQLAPGWKIYWRSPGDAGIPPQFDWAGSKNLKESVVSWPLPELFEAYGFSSWGYHDEVVFPIAIELSQSNVPLDLKLHLRFGICEQVCIPYEHDLSLSLNADSGKLTSEAPLIAKYAHLVPPQIGSKAAEVTQVHAEALGNQTFKIMALSASAFEQPGIIVEGNEGSYFSQNSVAISENGGAATFDISADLPGKKDRIEGQVLTVTVFDKSFSAEGKLTVR
ncbi:MAG: hypothetical protein K9G33_09040 [Sneathiella sp.]|nr:hypothetical protein [Sneathiella sp.]